MNNILFVFVKFAPKLHCLHQKYQHHDQCRPRHKVLNTLNNNKEKHSSTQVVCLVMELVQLIYEVKFETAIL